MNACCKILLVVVALVVVTALAGSAQAQAPGAGCGYGDGYYGLYYYLANNPNIQPPPHFALHPPVYYSYPVPRTYGYSPFPYPAYVMTPDPLGATPKPVTMINPYVPQKKAEPASDQTTKSETTASPQMIVNPFVGPTAVAHAR